MQAVNIKKSPSAATYRGFAVQFLKNLSIFFEKEGAYQETCRQYKSVDIPFEDLEEYLVDSPDLSLNYQDLQEKLPYLFTQRIQDLGVRALLNQLTHGTRVTIAKTVTRIKECEDPRDDFTETINTQETSIRPPSPELIKLAFAMTSSPLKPALPIASETGEDEANQLSPATAKEDFDLSIKNLLGLG